MDYVFGQADFSYKTQIFTSSGEYHIPKGSNYIDIICVGAGGGGGGGRSAAAGTVRAGGGGGGGGAITPRTYQTNMLPDSLIIYCGVGGAGGAAGVAGTPGQGSYVDLPVTGMYTLSPNTRILTASGGTGGGAGTTVAGTAGTGGVIQANVSQWVLGSIGIGTSFAGQNGTVGGVGGAAGVGGAITFGATPAFVMGGTGGGGCDGAATPVASAGGLLTGAGPMPSAAGVAINANGYQPYLSLSPLLIGPGLGGGGSTTTAGRGGDGTYGAGGGGGGGGVTGGAGGKGGDGFVIITCW